MNLPSDLTAEPMQLKVERADQGKPIADIVAALSTIEALKGLTEEELTWLATHGTQRFGKDGELIFSQGTPPEHLMFILHGDVIVKRHSSSPVSGSDRPDGPDHGQDPFLAHQGMECGRTLLGRYVDSGVARQPFPGAVDGDTVDDATGCPAVVGPQPGIHASRRADWETGGAQQTCREPRS